MGFMGFGLKCDCGCETPNHLADEDAVKWWNKRTSMPSGVLHQNTADLIRQAAEQIDKCSQALSELKEVWKEELDGDLG